MKKQLFLLVILCLSISLFAQDKTDKNEFPNEDVQLLTFNLFTPLAFDTPRYRLGYTHGISGHLRAGIEVGYGSENTTVVIFDDDFSDRDNYALFEILPQITYIFNPTHPVNHYIALQGFYLNQDEQFFNNSYFESNLRVQIRYDQADYNRKKVGANLLYGVYIPFGNAPIGIDISGGLGIRSRKNTYSNIVNPRAENFFDDDEFFENYREDSGTRVGINFSLGFKLTYNLNN